MVLDIMPFFIIAIGVVAVGLSAPKIIEVIIQRKGRQAGVIPAINGAEIHTPPNIKGKVASLSSYSYDPKKKVMIIALPDGTTTQRIIDLNLNLKIYNAIDALTDKEKTIWVANVTEEGDVIDNFMGVDFTPRALMRQLEIKESEIKSLVKIGEEFVRSPLNKDRFLADMELIGEARKRSEPQGVPPPITPFVSIENAPKTEEEE